MDRRGNPWSERGRGRESDEGYRSRGHHQHVRGRGRGRARGRHGEDRNTSCESYRRDGNWSRNETDVRRPGYGASLPEPESVVDSQTSAVQRDLSQLSLQNGDKIFPVKRPDKGGSSCVQHVGLLVNHFRVTFDPKTIIRHYDVDIKPETSGMHGRPVRLSKATLYQIKEKLFSDNSTQFPLSMTAYDGEKNIFSATPLPRGLYTVKLSSGEEREDSSFQCTITLVKKFDLFKLKDYLEGNLVSIPRDILQGMDVVMKENSARHMISVGRHFYPFEYQEKDDLKCGVAAFRGFQHSLKPTCQGLALSLDCSAMAFRKRMPVIDFLRENIRGFNINQFEKNRRRVEEAVKGVQVTVTHRKTNQKFRIAGLTAETTGSISFDCESSEGKVNKINLVSYFRENYNIEIKYRDIPCLDLSKNKNRKQYVPMELCVLVEGQKYPREKLDRDASNSLKRLCLPSPHVRKQSICDIMRSNTGPCGDVCGKFGIEVDMNMTKAVGRVITPPELKLAKPGGGMMKITVDAHKRHWNLMRKWVVDGKPIENWVVVDFSTRDRNRLNPDVFIPKLIKRCRSMGIRMEEPLFYEEADMSLFSNVAKLTELFKYVNDRACGVGGCRPQFLLCVMSRKDNGYKHLKWICETRLGLVTQCCLSEPANEAQDQYLANLAIKINGKLGGNNVELFNPLPHINDEGHVMILGADVNHPASRDMDSPSIAAVVGTLNWPPANRYAARCRPQFHRREKIVDIGEMCLELVRTYFQENGVRPRKILLFRDGVSESQFDMVLNEELQDLKKAFAENRYHPTITIIVAQKRHQTRLFPVGDNGAPVAGNVPPGTVMDTTIVHPFEFDFYLCSHYGQLGTSKPTHYYVLWDEHRFSSDDLQELIYSLCFTFARCTKPVSLVPPVYYADLFAYRGRLYYQSVMEQSLKSTASSSSSTASASSSLVGANEGWFCKLHTDVENKMFFI